MEKRARSAGIVASKSQPIVCDDDDDFLDDCAHQMRAAKSSTKRSSTFSSCSGGVDSIDLSGTPGLSQEFVQMEEEEECPSDVSGDEDEM